MNRPIRKAVIEALQDCGSFVMPDRSLKHAVADLVRGQGEQTPLGNEMSHELTLMENEGLIVGGRNPLKEISWKLTAAGSAAAAELNL